MTHVNRLKRRRPRGRPLTLTSAEEGSASASNRWCSSTAKNNNSRNTFRGVLPRVAFAAGKDHARLAAGALFASTANEKRANRQQFQSTALSGEQGVGTDSRPPLVTMEAENAGVVGEEEAVREVWCTDQAVANACEAEPRLAAALREFEAKQPGATLM